MTIADSGAGTLSMGFLSSPDAPSQSSEFTPVDSIRPGEIEIGERVRITSRAGTVLEFVVDGSDGSFKVGRVSMFVPENEKNTISDKLRGWVQGKVWDEATIRTRRPLSLTVIDPDDRASVITIGEVVTVETSGVESRGAAS